MVLAIRHLQRLYEHRYLYNNYGVNRVFKCWEGGLPTALIRLQKSITILEINIIITFINLMKTYLSIEF